ncbi:ATP-binding protein, partial [Paracoccus sp. DMF-8]|uniref:ATP-binding protein n=1 Tax=Paracoccus sp. DMF-8 TaxID=3019445 RepID=UPI0023E3E782
QDHFDELPVALLLLDPAGVIVRANSAARELLGGQIDGKSLATLLEGPGRPLCDWVADVATGRLVGGPEVLRSRSAGPEHFVQVTLRRSEESGVTAVLSDASDLKKLEAQFAQSQKMQAIGQLAGGIAHDFNNLLTAISGHCDLLMLRHDKGDPDYADLEQINQNANRAAALVGQLLAFSRKQKLKLQMLDLRDSLSDLTHLLNRLVGERIVLTFHHDPKLHLIRADKRQLEQVIMNLVVNARDAMVDGGDITITTGNVHFDSNNTHEQAILPPGDYVCVAVQDQGCGIPPDVLDKMFEPFFSTKRVGEGTGLGLSTAYGIVKQTGGYIFCDSVVGEGSRFSLYFPAHIGQVAEADPAPAPKPSAVRAEPAEPTVLLVEDEAPVRAFASRALQLQGCRVYEASCAEEALEILSDQRLMIDVFVTDVVMPGMDGPAWVRTALRDRPATRVIFMSGYTEDIFADGNAPIPGASFLAKPFSLSDLTALVSKQLDGRNAEGA